MATKPKLDTLGREKRPATPHRIDYTLTFDSFTEHHKKLATETLQLLNIHGYLPTSILYEGVRHLCSYRKTYISKHLRDKLWKGGYIKRPAFQTERGYHRNGHDVYELRPLGVKLLKELDLYVPSYSQKNPPVHGLMVSTVSSTFHIICKHIGWKVELAHELGYEKHISHQLGKLELRPDYHFRIWRPDQTNSMNCFVEADRNTETGRKTIRNKLKLYMELAKKGRFRLLFVTTTARRQKMVLELCRELDPDLGLPWCMVQHDPQFVVGDWCPPKGLSSNLFYGEWHRANRPPFVIPA